MTNNESDTIDSELSDMLKECSKQYREDEANEDYIGAMQRKNIYGNDYRY